MELFKRPQWARITEIVDHRGMRGFKWVMEEKKEKEKMFDDKSMVTIAVVIIVGMVLAWAWNKPDFDVTTIVTTSIAGLFGIVGLVNNSKPKK